MVLGQIGKQPVEKGAYGAGHQLNHAAFFGYFHETQPKGEYTGKAQRNFKAGAGVVEGGVDQIRKDLQILQKEQAQEGYHKGDEKEGDPYVVEYHGAEVFVGPPLLGLISFVGGAKLLARDVVYGYFPNFYVAHGRVAVAEGLVTVLAHNDVQGFAFFVHVVHKGHPAKGDYTLRFHAVAAGYFGMLKGQGVVGTEGNADVGLLFQGPYHAPFGRSEERRVGKECRSRGLQKHIKILCSV